MNDYHGPICFKRDRVWKMNQAAQIEKLQKRNSFLEWRLIVLSKEAAKHHSITEEALADELKRAQAMTVELNGLKDEWNRALDDIRKQQKEYEKLNNELKVIKQMYESAGYKIPWYKKIGFGRN